MNKSFIPTILFGVLIILAGLLIGQFFLSGNNHQSSEKLQEISGVQNSVKELYWFVLHRKSNKEFLYVGEPGDANKSSLVKEFKVKSGVPGKKPTPLPNLLGREYWLIDAEFDTSESSETAPYFLKLNIPFSEDYPYGPTPYNECDGNQCDWELPGSFGLHGTAGDPNKIADENLGSSGCVRHSDEDITYLYNLLDPEKSEIRYYIEDI